MPGREWFGEAERQQVNEVLETGVLMRYNWDAERRGVWKARDLEVALKARFGVAFAQLTSSGTAALLTALSALGVGAGDAVILPTFTFVASFEAVLALGAIPVLVDVDESLTLDPQAVARAITSNTKLIMPVHMCGGMAEMDALLALARKHGTYVLEDACQAIGGTYKGKPLGAMGAMGCFSFDYVKTITCGEGGAVLTDREALYTKSNGYTDHGHDHIGSDRGAERHPFLGLNFRISELQAAVGLAQLKKLDDILTVQRRHKAIVKSHLAEIGALSFRKIPDESGDNASFLSFFMPDAHRARAVAKQLTAHGITGIFYWYDNNWHYVRQWAHLKACKTLGALSREVRAGMPDYASQDFSQSDAIIGRCISTAVSLNWTEAEAHARGKAMATVVKRVLQQG